MAWEASIKWINRLLIVEQDCVKKKWWPIFCYLLDISVTDSWLLMKRICPGEKDCACLLIFRRNIPMSLLQTYGKPSGK
ncbi:hypothetical protein HHI36_020376, partial [Cryptolaemus montrouzieri]